jgi:hypothetical protein
MKELILILTFIIKVTTKFRVPAMLTWTFHFGLAKIMVRKIMVRKTMVRKIMIRKILSLTKEINLKTFNTLFKIRETQNSG